MWPGEDATSWCSDAAGDCPPPFFLFRKCQSPPTQFLQSPLDVNLQPPDACRIQRMLEIVVPVHRRTYCACLPACPTETLDVLSQRWMCFSSWWPTVLITWCLPWRHETEDGSLKLVLFAKIKMEDVCVVFFLLFLSGKNIKRRIKSVFKWTWFKTIGDGGISLHHLGVKRHNRHGPYAKIGWATFAVIGCNLCVYSCAFMFNFLLPILDETWTGFRRNCLKNQIKLRFLF